MICDRIWLARFAGKTVSLYEIDRILSENFSELEAKIIMEDGQIESLTNHFAPNDETIASLGNIDDFIFSPSQI